MLRPAWRSLILLTHVLTSVGWFGAVGVFLALAVWGLGGGSAAAQAAGPAMQLATVWIIVPLGLASPLTGILLSLGTPWGLVRHYWVAFKLAMTVASLALLTVHLQPVYAAADAARVGDAAASARFDLQLAFDAGAALIALIVMTGLSIYKPRGLTPFARAD
jgi:hypothetical protein